MSGAAATTAGWRDAGGDRLIRAFNEVRDELVHALVFQLGSQDDAQDALQEAFLKCWRAQESIGKVRNLRGWIFRVGLNAARDLRRNAWRRRVRPLDAQALGGRAELDPLDTLVKREALDRVRLALADLRPEEREVFLLRQNSALTYEAIATLRHVPTSTVKTQMRAALDKLRLRLQD